MKIFSSLCIFVFCVTANGYGVIFDNFETYTAGTNIVGTGNWYNLGTSSGTRLVSPTGSLPLALSGSQSGGLTNASGFLAKTFANSNNSITDQGTTLEIKSLIQTVGITQLYYQYLTSDGALTGLGGGMEFNTNGSIFVYGKKDAGAVTSYNSGQTFLADKTYALEMTIDFSDDSFKAYYTNITDSGSKIELTAGGVFTLDPGLAPYTLTDVLGNGGLAIRNITTGTGNDQYFDDIEVSTVPEPSTGVLALFGACALGLLRRRKVRPLI